MTGRRSYEGVGHIHLQIMKIYTVYACMYSDGHENMCA